MPLKLSTTIRKIQNIPNKVNVEIINEFHGYMRDNGSSEHHQNNNLKVVIGFGNFLGENNSFYDIKTRQQVLSFLDTKVKTVEEDPDKKWVTTWNNYLNRMKLFYRWLYNHNKTIERENWQTPDFFKIKPKKSKRVSPYLESEIWEKEELLTVLKYEPHKRNRAALTLFWDLNGRNHEITLLKLKHIRIKENYGEGEVPHESKTGSGPVLLTTSFIHVRDWINEHPFKNSPNASLICNLITGAPVKPDAMWTIMDQLKRRITTILREGTITNGEEKEKLESLLRNKKWNPYCLRHSSISNDSDYLPDYALKKKVRWSMNSKQGSRYIKRRMGNDLKQKILEYNGIIPPKEFEGKASVLNCHRCGLVNPIQNKYCSKCSYPLVPSAFEEIKLTEEIRINQLEEKYERDMKEMRQLMENKFNKIIEKIDINELA